MTRFEKINRCCSVSTNFFMRQIDGAWWATDGKILVRMDDPPGSEECGRNADDIKRVLDKAIAALPEAIPARLGALGEERMGILRKIIAGGEEHYIQERYIALMRGELFWIGGGFSGPHHCLAGLDNGVLVSLVKGTRDEEIAPTWKPITNGYDPMAEAEWYRNLALYPDVTPEPITLTKCPRCGACPAEHRCECGYDPAVMTAEDRSRAVIEHVEAIRALIYQDPPLFACFWCGDKTATRHGVREHVLVCPENPVTVRLAAREKDIERAVEAIGRAEACWSDANSATCLRAARQALQRLPEVTSGD